jgi:hypothetical protein
LTKLPVNYPSKYKGEKEKLRHNKPSILKLLLSKGQEFLKPIMYTVSQLYQVLGDIFYPVMVLYISLLAFSEPRIYQIQRLVREDTLGSLEKEICVT